MLDPSGLQRESLIMDLLFAMTIAALFSGLHHEAGSVKLQLSDLLAVLVIFLAALRGFATPRVSKVSLILLVVYLLYYTISAMFVELSTGVVKCLQNFLVFGFLFVAFGYYRTRPTDRLLILSTVLIVLVLAVNIGWHVLHGQYVGWKDLNEPKTIFTLLPMLLILVFTRFGHVLRQPLPLLAVLASTGIILLSGERKAYIFGALAFLVWMGPSKVLRYGVLAALAVPLFWAAASADKTGYLHRQLESLQSLASGTDMSNVSAATLFDESRPTTLSNAEREFSNRLARNMWSKEPIWGIGTNAFGLAIRSDLTIPVYFRMGIHGEFFRTLYEDGIVGFALYTAVWLASFVMVGLAWPATAALGNPRLNKIKLLCVIMLMIYVAFEANKGLTLVSLCLLPFVTALPPCSMSRPAGRPRPPARTRPQIAAFDFVGDNRPVG